MSREAIADRVGLGMIWISSNSFIWSIGSGSVFTIAGTFYGLGGIIAGDAGSYRYLAESIRMHPDQETLRGMMQEAGLEDVRYHNLSGGIVALHIGYRY